MKIFRNVREFAKDLSFTVDYIIEEIMRYLLHAKGFGWRECTRQEYIDAEGSAGFFSKSGENEPATASFYSSRSPISGMILYVDDDINPEKYKWDKELYGFLVKLQTQHTSSITSSVKRKIRI